MEYGKPIFLNTMSSPPKRYRLLLDVTVGCDDLEDAVNSVKLMLDERADELFVERSVADRSEAHDEKSECAGVSLEVLKRVLPEWNVSACDDTFEITRHSPAGEEVVMTLEGETLDEMANCATSCYDDFDPDDHAAMIYHSKHHGTPDEQRFFSGAPGDLDALIKDAHAIDEMYYQVYKALDQASAELE